MDLVESSSSEEETEEDVTTEAWGGSRHGRSANVKRDFEGAYQTLVQQYFSGEASLYNEASFERRFGVPRCVFSTVFNHLNGVGIFEHKWNPVTQRTGIHPLVRMIVAFRMIAYGDCADRMDESLQVSESSAHESLKHFCRMVVEEFGDQYLNRSPTQEEKQAVLDKMAQRGFPGCFASWDCKHYKWSKCPVFLAGQYKGKEGCKTLILEAIADCDLYLWYTNFGIPGTLNDINILDTSSILGSILDQSFNTKVAPYRINNHERDWLYFLVDGIYPPLAIFAKTFSMPLNEEQL